MFFSSAKVVTFRPNLVTLSTIPKFGCVLFSHPSSRFERKSFAAKRLSNRQRMGKVGSSFIASFKTDFSVFAKVVSFEDLKTPSLPCFLSFTHLKGVLAHWAVRCMQCNQMATLCFQYLAIYSNEKLHKSIHIVPK